jgi:hypothetical protein
LAARNFIQAGDRVKGFAGKTRLRLTRFEEDVAQADPDLAALISNTGA